MKITLNKNQKVFLFENYYITAKSLDACVERGWQDYFMDYFQWELDLDFDKYGFRTLKLKHIENETYLDFDYVIGLNFHGNDLKQLQSIK